MSATSKSLIYFLPQFTCLTKLTFYRQDQDDVTLFDILLCCKNIIDLKYTSQASIPYRATSQVNTTDNKHLKRLTISSPISTSAYINYIRIVQPLDYLKLSTPQDRYEIFQVIEPFAEVFQKFKEVRLKFKGREASSIPPSLTDTFYSVLCKLKGDRNLLYDATFSDDGYASGDTVAICDNKLSFCYVVGESASLFSNNTYCLVDSKEIVKAVTINGRRSSFTGILNYAKTFPRAKNFNIDTHGFNCKINKTEVIINCSSPSQEIFAHLKDCSPHAETIAFEQEINFVCAVSETTWDLTAFKSLKSFSFIVGNCVNMVYYTFLAFKFIYGDFHCYKEILLKKNIPVVDTTFEDTFTVIVKVHSQLVKINCNTKKLTTQLNLKCIH
ncbi:hypothetical protein INT47_005955 [Mucor saturninus]|uniref:Uncharacterized protein n=1 Tax=Mucor saturninus TaxID=64648 RepID=A0A8H7V396_9FUNG|nr:hypothetical protein INT47_005955 [Mucor saturninus]